MALALVVGSAGAVGAVVRYLLDGAVQDRSRGPFPFGTLVVNILGSLIFGFLAGLAIRYAHVSTIKRIIGTGFCGGLTTWSTAAWESVRLTEEGSRSAALTFTVANLVASLMAAGVGLVVFAR